MFNFIKRINSLRTTSISLSKLKVENSVIDNGDCELCKKCQNYNFAENEIVLDCALMTFSELFNSGRVRGGLSG